MSTRPITNTQEAFSIGCNHVQTQLHIITLVKELIAMPRKAPEIKVIIHMPEDKASLDALQESTNELFCHIVEKKFRNLNLTDKERAYVVKRITENLNAQAT